MTIHIRTLAKLSLEVNKNGIHLLEVIFTGGRLKHYSICNKTITGFCISEYELLLTCKTNIDLSLRLQ